jgi:hypothetical protein
LDETMLTPAATSRDLDLPARRYCFPLESSPTIEVE